MTLPSSSVKGIANRFRAAIQESSSSPECERKERTLRALGELIEALSAINEHVGEDEEGARLRGEFRHELRDLLPRGPFWSRALSKPQGYPGDFALLAAILAFFLRRSSFSSFSSCISTLRISSSSSSFVTVSSFSLSSAISLRSSEFSRFSL